MTTLLNLFGAWLFDGVDDDDADEEAEDDVSEDDGMDIEGAPQPIPDLTYYGARVDIDSADFVINTSSLLQVFKRELVKVANFHIDARPLEFGERYWQVFGEVATFSLLIPVVQDMEDTMIHLCEVISHITSQPLACRAPNANRNVFASQPFVLTLHELVGALNIIGITQVRVNCWGRKIAVGFIPPGGGNDVMLYAESDTASEILRSLMDEARLCTYQGKVWQRVDIGFDFLWPDEERDISYAVLFRAGGDRDLQRQTLGGTLKTFPLMGYHAGGIHFTPQVGHWESFDPLRGMTRVEKAQAYFRGKHYLRLKFPQTARDLARNTSIMKELVEQAIVEFGSLLSSSDWDAHMQGFRFEVQITGPCLLSDAAVVSRLLLGRLQGGFTNPGVMLALRFVPFEAYRDRILSLTGDLSRLNAFARKGTSAVKKTDLVLQYALLNYIGYYNPRLTKYRTFPSTLADGDEGLRFNLPENDIDYFFDGIGLEPESPMITAAKQDLVANLYIRLERWNGTNSYASRRTSGQRGPMSPVKIGVFYAVWDQAGLNWRNHFRTRQQVEASPYFGRRETRKTRTDDDDDAGDLEDIELEEGEEA